MMREILFRGKRADGGGWVQGYLTRRPSAIQMPGHSGPWYIEVPPKDPNDSGGVYNVLPDTVGQYIGVTDLHGVKVFEGDVVLERYRDPELGIQVIIGEIFWSESRRQYEMTYGLSDDSTCLSDDGIFEIVGNIYDSPGWRKEAQI